MVCSPGDKPIITYRFGNGNERRYQSDFAPIDVIIGNQPIDTTSNFNREGYKITFYSPNNFRTYAVFIKDYYLNFFSLTNGYPEMNFLECNKSSFTPFGSVDISTIVINYAEKCPTQHVDTQKASIEIFYNNLRIFQDQGNAPIAFNVQCGKCPPGTCECVSPIYPGYCCLDCSATAASIRAITNELRAKNG